MSGAAAAEVPEVVGTAAASSSLTELVACKRGLARVVVDFVGFARIAHRTLVVVASLVVESVFAALVT